MSEPTMTDDLTKPYPLTPEQIERYQKNGYIKLKEVLTADTLAEYGSAISELVKKLNTQDKPLDQRDTYGKAFLQIGNLWTQSEKVKAFALSERLGRIAAELMKVDGVRLYHDQALFKEPGGGYTPWHADQFYWPVSSNNTVTAWVPLQAIPAEMGPLSFCVGSQSILAGRDLGISDESEEKINRSLKDFPKDETPYDLGEVSFHSGWVFHRAGPNTTDRVRGVMTMIYLEDGIRLIEPKHDHHRLDWEMWLPGAEVGEVVDTPLNPVVYHV